MSSHKLPRASLLDTLGFLSRVVIPTVAKGVIIRRPGMVALAERFQLDTRAVKYMQKLRAKYGVGPLFMPVPIQSQALILAPQHVHHVLENSEEPFALDAAIKRSALSHFEPKNVLVSHGEERAVRRQFHEDVLDFHRPVHRLAERFIEVIREEGAALPTRELAWDDFAPAWFRVVRRIVFGDSARDDQEITDMIDHLRSNANWAFARPKQKKLRAEFLRRVGEHLDRAEAGSLASVIAHMPRAGDVAPAHQVPQWLFAFDPAGMTVFRALALLAAHPDHLERAHEEVEADQTGWQQLPFLRAAVLEALRLWPTTPMILRESTRETQWETGTLPAKSNIIIYAPFFHRDDQRLAYAHRFTPELWLEDGAAQEWPLVPFSGGPGVCPGRQLVLLSTSAMLAHLISGRQVRLKPANRLDGRRPLPGTLNNYALRFAFQ